MEQPVEKEKKGPDEYEIKRWADTVTEAHEIMQDPEKMKLISPILQKKKAALAKMPVSSVSDMKKKANMACCDDDEEMEME